MLRPVKITLKTYYRIEFLGGIVGFVTEAARCFGATPKEAQELGMAAEEAAVHIIEGYPGEGLDEQFEVICAPRDEGLEVVLSNMGLPVNTNALPHYTTADPEGSIKGLGFFLIAKLVHSHQFVNEGHRGWRTVLFKRLAGMRVPERRAAADTDPALAVAREKLTVRRAELADAPAIVELAYHNYRYSYSKRVFYFADQLQDALRTGQVVSFVAVNPAGRIVGQMALLFGAETRKLAELGAVMVQPEYRRSMGLLQMVKALHRYAQEHNAETPMAQAYLVTTHTLSQRVCSIFHFAPMALRLSVHGRARFEGIATGVPAQRESLLYAVIHSAPDNVPVRLCAPPDHAAMIGKLFQQAAVPVDVRTDPGAPDPATRIRAEVHPDEQLASLWVEAAGQDLAATLRARLFELEADGIKTVMILWPAARALPAAWTAELRALQAFFCGVQAETPDTWWLLYTRLNAQRFDFNQIHLCDPAALELRDYVQQGFQALVEDPPPTTPAPRAVPVENPDAH